VRPVSLLDFLPPYLMPSGITTVACDSVSPAGIYWVLMSRFFTVRSYERPPPGPQLSLPQASRPVLPRCPVCTSYTDFPLIPHILKSDLDPVNFLHFFRLAPASFWSDPRVVSFLAEHHPSSPPAPSLDDFLASPCAIVAEAVVSYLRRPEVQSTFDLPASPSLLGLHDMYAVPSHCATTCSHLSGDDLLPLIVSAWNSSRLEFSRYRDTSASPPRVMLSITDRDTGRSAQVSMRS